MLLDSERVRVNVQLIDAETDERSARERRSTAFLILTLEGV